MALLAVGAAVLAGTGCGGRAELHPALRVENEDLQRAISKGRSLIRQEADVDEARTWALRDANVRVSREVIIRKAGCSWPVDEIALAIAEQGDDSDAGVRRAARRAMRLLERELKFMVVMQVPKSRDPASVEFALRTSRGVEYPPIAVETPTFLREVVSPFDADAPRGAMYYYVVRFPIRGGPGVPPVGPTVSALNLVVRDGQSEGAVDFPLRAPRRR
jgi:hypothetical protein